MPRVFSLLSCLIGLLAGAAASAQGLLIDSESIHPLPRPWIRPTPLPQPRAEYSIKSLEIQARLLDQVAQVQVSQTFVNTGQTQMEVQFVFPLPYDGAVDQLTLLVDGEEWPAELLPADKARRRYEEIVRRSKDPALLEWLGRGLFQTNIFPVPPGQERTVSLHYHQLLRKDQGVTDFLFPLRNARYTAKPVEKLHIRVTIDSTLPIRNVYSPSHAIQTEKSGNKSVRVTVAEKDIVPAGDFRLFYDVNPKKIATSVLSYRPNPKEDGYFLLLSTPQAPDQGERLAKTVVFVVDKSGSMSGEKMEQAREALKFVLNNLQEGDLFNIVAYNSQVESFRPELERFTAAARQQAIGFVEGLSAGGGTNIHDALLAALGQLQDRQRPSYVLFLTDGLPTVGERSEAKIAAAAREANKVRARVLNFGVGYDVNSRLLDRLGRENFGASEYVQPGEDIEMHVSRVYSRISAPVLTDVEVTFDVQGLRASDGKPVNRVYPSGPFDLFAGEQAVLVGRYRRGGDARIVLRGKIGEEEHSYDFGAKLVDKSGDHSYAFVEKLWAMRRIGEIIDELDLGGKNQELIDELVALSTKHGILTPYTSFLAEEQTRPTPLAGSEDFRRNAADAGRQLHLLESEAQGRGGVLQRADKQFFKGADRPQDSFYFLAPPSAAPWAAAGLVPQRGIGYREAASGEIVVTESVRQVGPYALYKRGKIVCTPETAELFTSDGTLRLELDKLKDKVRVIERFSPEYFELCRANAPEENQLLASQSEDEELLVNLRGQAYLIK